jgi:Fur family transcriptional regulator, stress-responsive regulator
MAIRRTVGARLYTAANPAQNADVGTDDAIDRADVLRQHGLQVTAQRLAVMRTLARHPHSTADTIVDAVTTEIGSISRRSVYDTLGVLVDKGVLRRIQPAGSAARYEDRVGDNHHHLVCRNCGHTADVDCAVGDVPCLEPLNAAGFDVDEAEVVYWGTCPGCRRLVDVPT